MKTNSTTPKTNKNHNSELLFETETETDTEETEEQPLIETPNINAPEEPSLELRKKDASKPLYLIRYE